MPLHELLQSQARAARDARTEFDSSDDEHSSADESEGEESDGSNAAATGDGDGDDGRMMDQRTTEEIQTSHGPFNPPPGWAILPKPAPTAAEWVDMIKTFKKGHGFWRGKRIAHIFFMAAGTWGLSNSERNSTSSSFTAATAQSLRTV